VSDVDVVIIGSGGANLASLGYALERLGARSRVSADPEVIAGAPRLLLPGVGAAADAMNRLHASRLTDAIRAARQPLLGVCLGMQLLYEHSEEGDAPGLGLVPGTVRRLPAAPGRPVPHMGWNTCRALRSDPLFTGTSDTDYFYFVHSYAAAITDCSCAAVDYGAPLCAAMRRGNFCGVQFHPERSGRAGARLLRNFLEL
jgi:glutamine amidotransferase